MEQFVAVSVALIAVPANHVAVRVPGLSATEQRELEQRLQKQQMKAFLGVSHRRPG